MTWTSTIVFAVELFAYHPMVYLLARRGANVSNPLRVVGAMYLFALGDDGNAAFPGAGRQEGMALLVMPVLVTVLILTPFGFFVLMWMELGRTNAALASVALFIALIPWRTFWWDKIRAL